MKNFLSSLFLLVFLLVPCIAWSDVIVCPTVNPDPERNKSEARRYFQMGTAYFKVDDHVHSIRSFECVLKLVPYSLMARYQLAKSYEALQQYSKSRTLYRWILGEGSVEAEALKEEVEARLRETEGLEDRALTAEEQAGLADPPPPEPAPVKPAPAPVPGKPSWFQTLSGEWWFWTGVGATVVFTGLTVYGGLRALDLDAQWEKTWDDDVKDDLAFYKVVTDVSLAGAVLSAGALSVMMYLHLGRTGDAKAPERTTWVLPACDGSACTLTLGFTF